METQLLQTVATQTNLIRIVIVQYAGDYREAVTRFSHGESENYYAQKYSVDSVAKVAQKVESVSVICCTSNEAYSELLSNGVRAIGAGLREPIDIKALIALIAAQKPTHLVLRTPIRQIIHWATKQNIKILLTLADSFSSQGLKNKVKNYLLASAINHKCVDWVGNHGINASLSLKEIGVNPNKIIPWDWPAVVTPDSFESKSFPNKATYNLIYVGNVIQTKGVGDLIEAIAKLKAADLPIHLKIVGSGDIQQFVQQAQQLEVEKQVEFTGNVSHKNVILFQRGADVAIVPSRHESSEGLPMTIYETLCTRTPIVASDHPMFRNILQHQQNAMIFSAGNPEELAGCIRSLLSDSVLYEKISMASAATWNQLQIPVKWADLVNAWLFDSFKSQQWLAANNLLSYMGRG